MSSRPRHTPLGAAALVAGLSLLLGPLVPVAAVAAPDGSGVVIAEASAYVANWFSDSVSVIDMATLRETARIAVPDGPRSLAVARGGDR